MPQVCTCDVAQVSIGLDFGATHSGVAVATFRTCDAHPDKSSQPQIFHSEKIPTVLRRQPGSSYFQFSQESQFPNENGDVLRDFKLALIDRAEHRDHADVHAAALLKKMLWSVDVEEQISELVSIYLRGLMGTVLSHTSSFPGIGLGTCNVVVSWPELWENNLSGSLDLLKEAVVSAGISPASVKSLTYIKEHEAAVHAVFYHHRDKLDGFLKTGNPILVADCGGITIDAATYHLQDSTTDSHMTRPLCRLTGSVVLDVAFREKVVSRIFGITGLREESEFPVDVKQKVQEIMENWHCRLKNEFNPCTLDKGSVPFKIQGKEAVITRTEMIKMFDKVTNQIVAVIRKLFMSSLDEGRTPECIILTGGLSLNEHVQRTVKRRLEQMLSPVHHPEFIMGGPKAWEAVAEGAALSKARPNSN